MFEFTPAQIGSIVAGVVGFTELIKLSKVVPDKYGLGIAAIVSALGIVAFAYSQPDFAFQRTMIWGLTMAYLLVVTAAAGVYGIIRESRGGDVTNASRTGFDGQRAPMDSNAGTHSAQREQSRGGTPLPAIALLLLAPAVLLAPACARRDPSLSPERSIALYATQVAGYLKETKALADGLHQAQVLPRPAHERTLEVLLKANEAGVRLTSALQVYDAATDGVARGDAAKQVDAALVTLGTLLPSVLTEITDAGGRAKVGLLVESVQRLILTIARATLPRPSAELRPVLDVALAAN